MSTPSLAPALARVRALAASASAPVAVKKAALLLVAVDRTVALEAPAPMSTSANPSPVAYLGALVTLLDQQIDGAAEESESEEKLEMVAAIAYLLAIVFPKVSSQVIRLKLSSLTQTLLQAYSSFSQVSPAIARDLLSSIESVLLVMDLATWMQYSTAVGRGATLKELSLCLLHAAIDPRPKVRKRAQDAVKKVLESPPPPSFVHPFLVRVVDYLVQLFRKHANITFNSKSSKGGSSSIGHDESEAMIALVFLKAISSLVAGSVGGDEKIRNSVDSLVEAILEMAEHAGGNIIVLQWVFQVRDDSIDDSIVPLMSELFAFVQVLTAIQSNPVEAPANLSLKTCHSILSKGLSNLRPHSNDAILSPLWLSLVSTSFRCTSLAIDRDIQSIPEAREYANSAFADLVSEFFSRDFPLHFGVSGAKLAVTEKAVEAFVSVILYGISDGFMAAAAAALKSRGKKQQNAWAGVCEKVMEVLKTAITGVLYKENWGAILIVIESAFQRFGPSEPNLIDDLLIALVKIRDAPNYSDDYPFKSELDSALEAAARSVSLERFTLVVPLNIFDVEESETRRPYLLSLFTRALKGSHQNASESFSRFGPANLNFFLTTVLPLYTALHERSQSLRSKGLSHPSKLFDTLAMQAFGLFPAISATVPSDTVECIDELIPRIMALVQTQKETTEITEDGLLGEGDIRPLIYAGLQALVDGHVRIASEAAESNNENDSDGEGDDNGNDGTGISAARNRRQRDNEDLEAARHVLARLAHHATRVLAPLCSLYTTPPARILRSGETKTAVLQTLHERGQLALEACVRAWLAVADERSVSGYFFQLVKSVLQIQTSIAEIAANETDDANAMEDDSEGNESPVEKMAVLQLKMYASMDLLCVLLMFLPEIKTISSTDEGNDEASAEIPADSAVHLFYRVLSGQLRDEDPTLQKKTYKALNMVVGALAATANSLPTIKDLMTKLIDPEVISCSTSGVKKPRMKLIQQVFEAAFSGDDDDEEALLMEFVPVALSEVMLCTKEASERARTAAYECLVAMGRKMLEIGIRNNRDTRHASTGNEESMADANDSSEQRKPSLREYMMMVVAGLAGTTTNMQSAAIACCGRLIFEFADAMAPKLVKELLQTVLVFLPSPNREIVKAALGFIKVTIVSVPQETIEDELENMINGMLTQQTKSNKGHFKAKIRNIIERLIRKFSYEAVEGFIPEADAKLIRNIRKIRERSLKKKAEKATAAAAASIDDGNNSDESADDMSKKTVRPRKSGLQSRQKEFEDALHGSDDDGSDSEDEGDDKYIPDEFKDVVQKKSKGAARTVIREGEDIVDFLDSGVISRVTTATAQASKSQKRKSRSDGFSATEDGRILINEEVDVTQPMDGLAIGDAQQDDLYKESITGEGAFKRLPDGSVKFVNNAKRRRDEEEGEARTDRLNAGASNMGGRWGAKYNRDKKKKNAGLDETTKAKMLGEQYKSKASKAKGDVKRANMPDPYAYIPLSGKIVGSKKKSTELSGDFKDVIKRSVRNTNDSAPKSQRQGSSHGIKKGNKKHK
ncbi:hypothetical protein HDU82_005845 [Entophlyctis luteolus]|nr:hypothetical protein HDU82_005845 [Entophlyctis luteolus]